MKYIVLAVMYVVLFYQAVQDTSDVQNIVVLVLCGIGAFLLLVDWIGEHDPDNSTWDRW